MTIVFMTPKSLLRSFPDADLADIVRDVLAWQSGATLSDGAALRTLVSTLEREFDFHGDESVFPVAEALVLAEAARRFANA